MPLIKMYFKIIIIFGIGYGIQYYWETRDNSHLMGKMAKKKYALALEMLEPTLFVEENSRGLWLYWPHERTGKVKIRLKSKRRKILSDRKVILESTSHLKNSLAYFSEFSFLSGKRMNSGHYSVEIIRESKKQTIEDVYVGRYSPEQFKKRIVLWNKKWMDEEKKFYEALDMKYRTLFELVEEMEKKTRKGKRKSFMKFYTEKVGQMMAAFYYTLNEDEITFVIAGEKRVDHTGRFLTLVKEISATSASYIDGHSRRAKFNWNLKQYLNLITKRIKNLALNLDPKS